MPGTEFEQTNDGGLKQLLRERKLVAPFKKTIASPCSYFLVQSADGARKPEVQEFAAWLRREARLITATDPDSSGRAGRSPA